MENKPQISIIVPIYNTESTLIAALDSIRRQSFANFECILVDDGSTDNSGALCDSYAAEDGRFKVIHRENTGPYGARNVGLEASKGEYIGFFDSDDTAHPDLFRNMLDCITSTQSDWVAVQYFRARSQDSSFPKQRPFECKEMNREQTFEYWFKTSKSAVMWMLWNKLYSRKAIGDLRFENIVPGGDQDFNFRFGLKSRKCAVLNQVLYNWVIRDGSITRRKGKPEEVYEKHTNLKSVFEFLKYSDPMSEKEKGYLYTKIIQGIITCRAVASKVHDRETLCSLKSIRSVTEPLFRKNSTIKIKEKTQLLCLLYLPFLYNLYLKIRK